MQQNMHMMYHNTGNVMNNISASDSTNKNNFSDDLPSTRTPMLGGGAPMMGGGGGGGVPNMGLSKQ